MTDRPKLTSLQENAARLFVEGNTQAEAYRKAGYSVDKCTDKSVIELASVLFATVKVSTRVLELQAEARERHAVTLDSLTTEYNDLKEVAVELEQISAAISAVNGKAKIHGYDKTVLSGDIKTIVKIVDMTGKKPTK